MCYYFIVPMLSIEPEVVAEAFDELYKTKRVRYFGVSNMTPYQIELIQNIHHIN